MKTQYLLTRMKCGRRLGISAAPEENNTYSPFTRFCVYDHHDRDDNKWDRFALDSCVQGVTIAQIEGAEYAGFCVISAEGDVSYFSFPTISERIPETGIHAPTPSTSGGCRTSRRSATACFLRRRPAVLQAQPLRGRDLALPRARPAPAARNAGLRLLHHAPHQRSPRARGLRPSDSADRSTSGTARPSGSSTAPSAPPSSTSTSSPTTRSGSAAATAPCSGQPQDRVPALPRASARRCSSA